MITYVVYFSWSFVFLHRVRYLMYLWDRRTRHTINSLLWIKNPLPRLRYRTLRDVYSDRITFYVSVITVLLHKFWVEKVEVSHLTTWFGELERYRAYVSTLQVPLHHLFEDHFRTWSLSSRIRTVPQETEERST